MSKVVRYFHLRPFGKPTKGGATVRVTGDTNILGQVDVQVAFCSRKDGFCKKIGREEAGKKVIKVVPLRYLPEELAGIMVDVGYKTHLPFEIPDYTYAIKYFLPKE